MPASMVTVAAAQTAARKRVERDRRDWAVTESSTAELDLPLHPPTEREVAGAPGAAREWVRAWQDDPAVRWTTRVWPSFGTQRVPERLVLRGAEQIATFAGRDVLRSWHRMRDAVAALRTAFPDSDALRAELRRSATAIAALDPVDLQRLVAVVAWLVAHPDSGLRVRQLPVHGVHTKWLERHRGLVRGLHTALTGRESLGLADRAELARVRILDPELRPSGLTDLTVPIEDLALLPSPTRALIVENLETLLALPPLDGTIAIAGLGYGVGGRLGRVPWLQTTQIRYWGDLDSHGFRILDDLRATFPSAASVLMDAETLEAHRDLAVHEEQNTFGSPVRLTAAETAALRLLREGGGLRIEQERLDWAWVLERLSEGAAPRSRGDDGAVVAQASTPSPS